MKNSPETLRKRNELKAKWKREMGPDTVPKTIKRVCKVCGELKDCGWNYTFSQTGKPEYRAKCVECFKAYAAALRRKHRQHITERHKQRLRTNKQRAVDYLGGKCEICGYNKCAAALTFHHINREEKETDSTGLFDLSWANIKKEIDKCQLLCFNCHMELHAEENSYH